jgi:hypothetical protein
MVLKRWRIIHGWKIFHGKIFGIESLGLLLFLQEKITSIRKISMRNGKTRRMSNFNKTWWVSEETLYKLSLMVTTLTINLQLLAKTQPLLTPMKSNLHRTEGKLQDLHLCFTKWGLSVKLQKTKMSFKLRREQQNPNHNKVNMLSKWILTGKVLHQ